jgi:hypothetical protein
MVTGKNKQEAFVLKKIVWVILLGGVLGFVSLGWAQVVYEPEAFEFTTGMGNIEVSPFGILEEVRARYKEKGQDLNEAGARLVPLEITLISDMGLIDIDLTGLNVTTLNVTSGMANINVILPESGSTSGEIITDMGNVILQVPASRTLAVPKSVTDMGTITVEDVSVEPSDSSPVILNLQTGMGNILIVPLGTVVEDSE